ncbi:hypothetical protein [Streptomyces blastmyceticus]|uniref:Uncharacterized protein n=1 Tax=Streptomyces blastmyceticus TaxID=68180 RepID=A0ABP3HVC1_9ACTN
MNLAFTDQPPGTHGRFRSTTARGRHGIYDLIEEAFTSTLMLRRNGSNYARTDVSFREVGGEAARRIEQAEDPSNATVYHLATHTYRHHQATMRLRQFAKDTPR